MRTRLTIFIVASFFFTHVKAQVNLGDSLALVDLYNSTGGPNWTHHTNWLTGKRVETWYGVYVSHDRVYNITLNVNNLSGQLPQSIGNLKALQTLNLDYNNLTGSIPVSVGGLKNLVYLNISRNLLTGAIPPEIGSIKPLRSLSLYLNKLTGTIPPALGNCSQLDFLSLSNNRLSGGVPKSFKKLTLLGVLGLAYNNLSGGLEDVFPEENLEFDFDLSYNHFTGRIPAFMGNFSKLISMRLNNNDLTGNIPKELGNLKSLEYLILSDNHLTGSIPKSLDSLHYLSSVSLRNNEMSEDDNPQYSGKKYQDYAYDVSGNRFTFNGLEYLNEKYPYSVYANPQADIRVHNFQKKLAVSAGGTLGRNIYKWFRVGESTPVIIKADSTFQPVQSGKYCALITNSIVAGLTLKTDTVVYTMPATDKAMITIFPNPAQNAIVISGMSEENDADISIADMNGYVWLRTMNHQQLSIKLDVSPLKAGNYVVSIKSRKELKTVQFVKQ